MTSDLQCPYCGASVSIRDDHDLLIRMKRRDFTAICPHGRTLWVEFNIAYWTDQRERAAKALTESVSVMMTPTDYKRLRAEAKAKGITVPELIRRRMAAG